MSHRAGTLALTPIGGATPNFSLWQIMQCPCTPSQAQGRPPALGQGREPDDRRAPARSANEAKCNRRVAERMDGSIPDVTTPLSELRRRGGLHLAERAVEIGHQIIGILQADVKAQRGAAGIPRRGGA